MLSWIKSQKNDQSIEEIDRDKLQKYIETKDFLAVMFCKHNGWLCCTCGIRVMRVAVLPSQGVKLKLYVFPDNDEDYEAHRVLRHLELIDDEAAEYGIKFTKCSDLLMAKKFGFREPPGIVYFRKGKSIKYDGELKMKKIVKK